MKSAFCIAVACLFCWLAAAQPAPKPPPVLARIALLSDTHTTRGTNREQPLYRGRLEKVIRAVNAENVDFVLIAGDLTENGKPEELEDFISQIKGFSSPVWFVPGNHDIGNKRVRGKESESTLSAARVSEFELSCGPSFFSHERAGIRVLGLNSSVFGSGLERENAMWSFLEAELAKPNQAPTLVFTHYPPFVSAPPEPSDYWNVEPEPRQRLLKMLREGGVKAVLSGHLHRSLTNHHDGILLVTTGPVSFGLPRGKHPQGWTLVTVPERGEIQTEFKAIDE